MAKKKDKAPKQITLSIEQAEQLRTRITKSELTPEDIEILLGLMALNAWIQERLSRAKLTIKRLRNLFGFSSESKKTSKKPKDQPKDPNDNGSNHAPLDADTPDTEDDKDRAPCSQAQENEGSSKKTPLWDPNENHGRYAANDYLGCEDIMIDFTDPFLLKKRCPSCAEHNTLAAVSEQKPSIIVRLKGQPLVTGTRYVLKCVRCSVCKTYFTAELPDDVKKQPKYDTSCATSLAIQHYYAGLPFKRIETLQSAQDIPLADATQYDLVNRFYKGSVKYVFSELEYCAAQGDSYFFDDTKTKVLEKQEHHKGTVHATAILSEYKGHQISLFRTNKLTAGKQLIALFKQRDTDVTFKTMSDASPNNFPDTNNAQLLSRWVICLCLAHGRRRFAELVEHFDEDAQFVLKMVGAVYHNESHCKREKLKPDERLAYHQKHSAPLMAALRIWFNNLLMFKKVEPNSVLGEAIAYMLKRWTHFTQFLNIPGASLDNNICEQAIKVIIRYRKNAFFYRTFYGANIGDAMMSLIHTSLHCGINIFDYFNALQVHEQAVRANPGDWLPWTYEETLIKSAHSSSRAVSSG